MKQPIVSVTLSSPAKRIFSITIDDLLPEGESELLNSVVNKIVFDGEVGLTPEEHVLLDSLLDHTLHNCESVMAEFRRVRGVELGREEDAA